MKVDVLKTKLACLSAMVRRKKEKQISRDRDSVIQSLNTTWPIEFISQFERSIVVATGVDVQFCGNEALAKKHYLLLNSYLFTSEEIARLCEQFENICKIK